MSKHCLNIIWKLTGTVARYSNLQLQFTNLYLQIAREVLDAAARVVRPGVTTDEIDRVVHEATIAYG